MQFREDQIYVKGKTKRRLRWVTNALDVGITPDEYADQIINKAIEERFPSIIEAEAEFANAEKKFAASLK